MNDECLASRKYNQKLISAKVICTIFGMYYIIYCAQVMVEVPHLTWFDQIPLAERFFSGQITIRDLLSRYGEHGMLATNILYLINCLFFNGSTLFDVVLNDINVILCGMIVLCGTAKTIENNKIAVLIMVAEAVFLFTCNQNSSGGMETQVRLGILFFLIAMIFVDKELRQDTPNKLTLLITVGVIILSINVFGTLYSFAGVPLVWLIIILKKEKRTNHLAIFFLYFITIFLYVWQYDLNFSGGEAGDVDLLGLLNPIRILLCIIAYFGNGVLGWAYCVAADYNAFAYMTMGTVVVLALILSSVLFFKEKMYEKTWIPLMMIVYSFGVLAMVYLGRSTDWQWMQNDWYNVHIKVSLAGAAWIFGFYLSSRINDSVRNKLITSVLVFLLGAMLLFSVFGSSYAWKRAPYVRAYYANMQKYLYVQDAKDMPVNSDGQTPLLHTLEMTMQSIEILQKYNLSIYQYWDAYEESLAFGSSNVGNTLSTCIREEGIYDDGWVGTSASVRIASGENGLVHISGWYGAKLNGDETITVFCDGEKVYDYKVTSDTIAFVFPVPENSVVRLMFETNFKYPVSAADKRELSFMLSSLNGS